MKKILLLLPLISSFLYSQEYDIYALDIDEKITDQIEERVAREGPSNKGIYVKDVNHVLDKYLGIWTLTTVDQKKYTLEFTKFTKVTEYLSYPDDPPHKEDMLLMKLKIEDLSNNEIIYNISMYDRNFILPMGYFNHHYINDQWVTGEYYYVIGYTIYMPQSQYCQFDGYINITVKQDNLNELLFDVYENSNAYIKEEEYVKYDDERCPLSYNYIFFDDTVIFQKENSQ